MIFQDDLPTKLRLIGYQPLTDHGLALPVFGADRNPNTHYCALCEPLGDVYGKISGFVEISTENFIALADERIREVHIGSPWLSVFLWDNQNFVGPADEIWKITATYRRAIAKDTPLTYLALTEFDPGGNSEQKASRAAYRWLSKKIGDRQALSWYKDSYLRGAMIRMLRAAILAEEAPSHLIEGKLYGIRVHERENVFYFDLPDDSFLLSQEQLTKIAIAFENKTGHNLSFKSLPSETPNKMISVRDKLLARDHLANIFPQTLGRLDYHEENLDTQNYEEQVRLRREDLLLVSPDKDPQKWMTLQMQLGYALLQLGKSRFRSDALEQSINLFRAVLDSNIKIPKKIKASAYTYTGEALKILGQWAGGWEQLATAVAAYRAALKQWSRDEVPLEWAAAQNELGNALQALGQREGTTERVYEAVAAYRAALEVQEREHMPLRWAGTQNNLGAALAELGAQEAGTARLEDAVRAYREALKERTRDRVPLDWAMTQSNLGSTLAELGRRQADAAQLEGAVTAFREALEERTRDRVPLDWAMTQSNLGNALADLSALEAGSARLEEAVIAYREALKERTRDRVPLDWAWTQNNLGNTLRELGEQEAGTARLEEAVIAYREALKERTRDRVPLDWAATQHNLGAALRTLGVREAGTARLEDAVTAFREALKERGRDRAPLDWAMTQSNLGTALADLGEREAGTARLEEAVTAFHEALTERTRDHVPRGWAGTQHNLGNCLATLAERSANPGPLLADALSHMQNAVDGFRQVGDKYWGPIAEKRLAELKAKARHPPHPRLTPQ
jgi:tetratricopeptide (TPR) repeat protein